MKNITIRILTLIGVLLLLTGCASGAPVPAPAPSVTMPSETACEPAPQIPAQPLRIACVGDSITYGYELSNREKTCYPAQLQELLGEPYLVVNFGVGGQTVQDHTFPSYRQTREYDLSLEFQPDILIFMMGSNDTKPESWVSEETFQQELLEFLNSYCTEEFKPVIYLCTPAAAFYVDDFGGGLTTYWIRPEIVGQIAKLIRRTAEEQGYFLIDIHALTAQSPELFQPDGVHPNEAGAEAIAREVYRVLQESQKSID